MQIETMVQESETTYMEAVIHKCEEYGVDVEVGAKLLNRSIKDAIAAEAQTLNMIRRQEGKLKL